MLAMSEAATLADHFLADRREAIAGHLATHGTRLAELIWQPVPAQLPDSPIRFLLDYWTSLKPADDIPLASAISPLEMRPALGHILLIDLLEDGWNGRFRLYGTKIAEMYGRDMTGRLLSDIDGGNYISVFFRALNRAISLRRQPVYSHHEPPPHVSVKSWRRLALPLAGEDGRVARLMVGNVPGDWRPPSLPKNK